ncbi:MAG: N-acetyl-gamma-glutamyl-phosphate reductase [Bacteroidota bacterium]
MIKTGIIGGAGYTAGELIRMLLLHPDVHIQFVQSNSQAGKPLSSIHTDLLGETDLLFSSDIDKEVDLLFLCTGHGRARSFVDAQQLPEHIRIIDLSRDYRLAESAEDFVYGLPELQKPAIQSAKRIANPGCFATAIQLALLPLAAAGQLQDDIHIHAITGSTGAGQQPVGTTHFSWRNNNVSIYKAFRHQHLDEIKQSLVQLQPGFSHSINFLPVRGNFSRGIFASAYIKSSLDETTAQQLYKDYYADAPFVKISPQNPSLKQVVNTNDCVLYIEKSEDKLLIISLIDNLLKGASGQAIQNMNLLFGLPQSSGLKLKAVAF